MKRGLCSAASRKLLLVNMKYNQSKKTRPAFYLLVVSLIFSQGCFEDVKQQNSNKNSREKSIDDLQRKSELQWYSPIELLNMRDEIDRELKDRFFAECLDKRDSSKTNFFTIYNPTRTLYEFVNLEWAVYPEGLKPVDHEMNAISFKGTLHLLSYGDKKSETQTIKSYVKSYNKTTNAWSEVYDELDFWKILKKERESSYSSEDERKKKASFHIEKKNGSWVINLPFQKPSNITCDALINEKSLASYDSPGTKIDYTASSEFESEADPPMPDEATEPLKALAYRRAKKWIKEKFTCCIDGNWYTSWLHYTSTDPNGLSLEKPKPDGLKAILQINGFKWNLYSDRENESKNQNGTRWEGYITISAESFKAHYFDSAAPLSVETVSVKKSGSPLAEARIPIKILNGKGEIDDSSTEIVVPTSSEYSDRKENFIEFRAPDCKKVKIAFPFQSD